MRPDPRSPLAKRRLANYLQDAYHYFGSVRNHDLAPEDRYDETFDVSTLWAQLECYRFGRDVIVYIRDNWNNLVPAGNEIPKELEARLYEEMAGWQSVRNEEHLAELCEEGIELVKDIAKEFGINPRTGAVL